MILNVQEWIQVILKVSDLVPSDFGNVGLSHVRHLYVFKILILRWLKIVKWKVRDLIPIDFCDLKTRFEVILNFLEFRHYNGAI